MKYPLILQNLVQKKRLEPECEVVLFRLIQEAVQNSIKHADASHIHVKIEITKNHIIAVVTDNGKGFDPSIQKDDSFGIIGMKERVDLFGGKLVIQSKVNKGTKVIIRIPNQ